MAPLPSVLTTTTGNCRSGAAAGRVGRLVAMARPAGLRAARFTGSRVGRDLAVKIAHWIKDDVPHRSGIAAILKATDDIVVLREGKARNHALQIGKLLVEIVPEPRQLVRIAQVLSRDLFVGVDPKNPVSGGKR